VLGCRARRCADGADREGLKKAPPRSYTRAGGDAGSLVVNPACLDQASCNPVTCVGAIRRDRADVSRSHSARRGDGADTLRRCAWLADFRIDFGRTAASHHIAYSRACEAARSAHLLCTLEDMDQPIRRGSRGHKATKAVMLEQAEEAAERQTRDRKSVIVCTAIDVDRLSGDEAGILTDQEQAGRGDLVDGALPAERDADGVRQPAVIPLRMLCGANSEASPRAMPISPIFAADKCVRPLPLAEIEPSPQKNRMRP